MKWLIPLIVLGCAETPTTTSETTPTTNPKALELHAQLFEAADKRDVQSFKKLFTPASRQLLNRYFASVNTLPRPENEAALGWEAFVKQHANLPKRARQKTPYPLTQVNGSWQLDITAHANESFFAELLTKQ